MRFLIVIFAAHALSAAVISSTQCTIQGLGTVSGETTCLLEGGPGFSAKSSVSVGMRGAFGVSVSVDSHEGSIPNDPVTIAFASGSIERTFTMITDGPMRPGLLSLQLLFDFGFNIDARGAFEATFGPYSGSGSKLTSSLSSVECGGVFIGPVGTCYQDQILPITLGVPIEVMTRAQVSGVPPSAFGMGYVDILAALFEADGVTPVEMFEVEAVPEPSTWALTALGLVALRRRKHAA